MIGAIKGEGKLFSMENFKEESRGTAKKYMRILYFALAAIMLLMAITNGLQTVLFSNRLNYFKVTDAYKETFSFPVETSVSSMSSARSFLAHAEGPAVVRFLSRQDPHERRFSAAVYTDESDTLSRTDLKGYVRKQRSVRKGLLETVNIQ